MPSVRKPSKAWLHSFQHRLIVSKSLIGCFGSINLLLETMGRGGWWKQQGLAQMPRRKAVSSGSGGV